MPMRQKQPIQIYGHLEFHFCACYFEGELNYKLDIIDLRSIKSAVYHWSLISLFRLHNNIKIILVLSWPLSVSSFFQSSLCFLRTSVYWMNNGDWGNETKSSFWKPFQLFYIKLISKYFEDYLISKFTRSR